MDISFQNHAMGVPPEAARAIEQSPVAVGPDRESFGASALPLSKLYPQQSVPDGGLTGVIDRVRADFEAFRLRLSRQNDPQIVDQTPTQALQHLGDSMDRAVKTQVDILELGLALNAGLTATQQSQNSVKTLLEKS